MTELAVRAAAPGDETAWRALWTAYNEFYAAKLAPEVTAGVWARILAEEAPIHCLVAERAGAVVGFANYVLHPKTWDLRPVCYLEDLFVTPAVRRAGVGRALLDHLLASGREQGWVQVYWVTEATNAVARRLYDSYAAADGFVRYRITL